MGRGEAVTALFLAWKTLTGNKSSFFFTMIIISLGFISSIVVYGVLENTGYRLEENLIETTVGHAFLEPYGGQESFDSTEEIIQKISTLPFVVVATPVTIAPLRLFDGSGGSLDVSAYIIDPEDYVSLTTIDEVVREGSWLHRGGPPSLVVGCLHLTDCNGLKAQPSVDLSVGRYVTTLTEGNYSSRALLQGVYDHTFIDVEEVVYLSRDTADTLYPSYDLTLSSVIIVRFTDRSYTDTFIRETALMNIPAKIYTWRDTTSSLSGIVSSFRTIGTLSFLIGMLISAVSIYVLLYINILNKRVHIGILKAIGIPSHVISRAYIILSGFLGVLGSLLGIVLTLITALIFQYYPIKTGVGNLVPIVSYPVLLGVSGALIVTSVLSGYFVSQTITKQRIIASLFHA